MLVRSVSHCSRRTGGGNGATPWPGAGFGGEGFGNSGRRRSGFPWGAGGEIQSRKRAGSGVEERTEWSKIKSPEVVLNLFVSASSSL